MKLTFLLTLTLLCGACALDRPSATATRPELRFSDDGRYLAHRGEAGKSALQTLSALTLVKTSSGSLGDFVISINGVAADPKHEYWSFTVNGKLMQVGAGQYISLPNDQIEWQVRSFKKTSNK